MTGPYRLARRWGAAACLCALLGACARGASPPTSSTSASAPFGLLPQLTVYPQTWPQIPLTITARTAVALVPSPPPGALSLPSGVQDMTFATANDGWLVTDGAAGAAHGLSAIYRTTDGGADWVPVWHGEGVHLSRIGLLPGTPTQIYATGVSVLPGTVGAPDTPLWLTSADGGVSWRVVEATLPESLTPAALGSAAATAAQAWSLLQFSFPTTSVGYAAPDPEYTQGGGALL